MAQMATESSDRKIIKIAVTPAAKTAIENFADRYDMKEFAVASRFYEWFAKQDDVYQRAVMGMLHGLEVDAARAFMERLAAKATAAGQMKANDIEITVTPPAPQSGSSGKGGATSKSSRRG